MKHFVRILSLSPIIIILSLFLTIPALALPPFPSSFWGTIKVNDANVPEGTLVQALIGGQVYAEGFSQLYQGDAVFALDIPGDDTGTTALDGGGEGDTIQFKIGGLLAHQTAIWHGGTNVRLDLTATASAGEPISPPQKTPRPIPTQTPMIVQAASPLPNTIQASPAPTLPAQPSPISTISSKSLQAPAVDGQPAPKDAPLQGPLQSDEENGPGSISAIAMVVIALPIVSAVGYTFLALRRRKM
jgi:hypothetical protein